MKLSIIIPLYNKEKYLERCLKSLLVQEINPNDYEVIVVDDGSTDSGRMIAEKYAGEHKNIHLICQENSGPSAARNNGIKRVKGEYIYFLDADDYIAANVLKTLLDLCEQNELEILEFNSRETEEGQLAQPINLTSQLAPRLDFAPLDGISFIAKHNLRNYVWRYLIKRSFLLDTGVKFLEDMRAYEDLIFTASVFLQSKSVSKTNLDAHRYVKASGSIVRSKDPKTNLAFINGMVKAVEELHSLINNLDSSHENYDYTVTKLRAKQQAIVFALIIRVFKYRLHNWKELNVILTKMNNLKAYPIDPKIGGINGDNPIYYRGMVAIFNNKPFLFLGTKIMRLIPRG